MASRTAPLSQDHDEHLNDDKLSILMSEYEGYSWFSHPYSCGGYYSDDDFSETENFLAGLPESAGILKSTKINPVCTSEEPKSGTCSPSIDLKIHPVCTSEEPKSGTYSPSVDLKIHPVCTTEEPKSGTYSPSVDLKINPVCTSEEPKSGTCSPSVDLKSKLDNAYDLPNTPEQPRQPIKRKREEEADLFSELPSPFAVSVSEEHPGSPKASSYSPPINIKQE